MYIYREDKSSKIYNWWCLFLACEIRKFCFETREKNSDMYFSINNEHGTLFLGNICATYIRKHKQIKKWYLPSLCQFINVSWTNDLRTNKMKSKLSFIATYIAFLITSIIAPIFVFYSALNRVFICVLLCILLPFKLLPKWHPSILICCLLLSK